MKFFGMIIESYRFGLFVMVPLYLSQLFVYFCAYHTKDAIVDQFGISTPTVIGRCIIGLGLFNLVLLGIIAFLCRRAEKACHRIELQQREQP